MDQVALADQMELNLADPEDHAGQVL